MYFYMKKKPPQNARFAKIDMMQVCFNIWKITSIGNCIDKHYLEEERIKGV